MEVPFSFLSGLNSSEVVTGVKVESQGGKKKGAVHLYAAYYVLCFFVHNFYITEDKISRLNVIFYCPSLLYFRFHIILYHDA